MPYNRTLLLLFLVDNDSIPVYFNEYETPLKRGALKNQTSATLVLRIIDKYTE